MKVKNIIFSGFAAAILMGVATEANAAPTTKVVASKGYVDTITGELDLLTDRAAGSANLVQAINVKQDKLEAGNFIAIDPNTGKITTTYSAGDNITISDTGEISASGLQEALEAGANITIEDGVISATDTTYSAGDNITISADGEISATGLQETLTAGNNITISEDGTISATDTTYTAGNNITISDTGEISATGLQKELTPGNFVAIDENGNITTTYSAGDNITIDATGAISTTFPEMPAACRATGVTCVLTSEGGQFVWAILAKPYSYNSGDVTDEAVMVRSGDAAQNQLIPEAR